MKILVIDDDTRLLSEIGIILKRNGYTVDCIDNADDAISILESNSYDFVLVDYRMPEHDGLWFLQNASLPKHTKSLLVTSYADRDMIRQMFREGISGYVMKPFDEDQLLTHLKFHSIQHASLENDNQPEAK